MSATIEQLVQGLKNKGITNHKVLQAIRQVPRHLFLDESYQQAAYDDQALPIECQQTISQPYIVARMTELLLPGKTCKKILEIGTGSGYQAAILAQLVPEVYSVERIYDLYISAKAKLGQLKISNVMLKFADGYSGWPEYKPYDGIIVTAASHIIPRALLEQLTDGGRLIIPVGNENSQVLKVITKQHPSYKVEDFEPVIFVPLLPHTLGGMN